MRRAASQMPGTSLSTRNRNVPVLSEIEMSPSEQTILPVGPIDPFFERGMWGTGTSNAAHLIVNYRY